MVTMPDIRRPLRLGAEQGFTLAELLIASMVSMVVLGSAVALTSQVQNGYRRQVESAAAEQEGRYALDWVGRLIRGAGNNPFDIEETECPGPGTIAMDGILFDPAVPGEIRLQTDSNPPDGLIGGNTALGCEQANEDITISYDDGNSAILFFDHNVGEEASIRTDAVIDDLRFIYRNGAHSTTDPFGNPITPAMVVYVETQITVRTRTVDPSTGLPLTRVLSSEVRVRSR